MFNSNVLFATTGLLALASAAPASITNGPCIDGVRLGVLRFDNADLKTGADVPNGYGGLSWSGLTVDPVPNYYPKSKVPLAGATPGNVITVSNSKDGGKIELYNPPVNGTFSIKSFSAACVTPVPNRNPQATDCEFELVSDSSDVASDTKLTYTVPKSGAAFTTFGTDDSVGFTAFQFFLKSSSDTSKRDAKTPTVLMLDNILIERTC